MRWLAPSILIAAAAGAAATPASKHEAARQAEAARNADVAARLSKRLAGLQPGHPVTCLPNSEARYASTHAYGPTILYEVNRGLVYRTDTGGGCESMERGDYIVTRSNGGQICSGDIGQTFAPTVHIPTGSCALGNFTPYRRP